MFEHVHIQAISVGKGFVALIAFIRLLTRVEAMVYCQIASCAKGFTALFAFIGFLTRMDALVCYQSAFM